MRALGVSDTVIEGHDDAELIGLAGDLQWTQDLSYTLEELSSSTGAGVEQIRSIFRLLGLDADELAGFDDDDAEMVALVISDTSGILDEIGAQLLRVAGAALNRIAEATVAAYVQDVEEQLGDASDPVMLAEQNATASALGMALGKNLSTVFKHHMLTAIRRQRLAQRDVPSPELVRQAVGFVDLVGFTALSHAASPAELIATIEDFERHAFETASNLGGRVVKSIGDEVMIAGPDAATVAAIALHLVRHTDCDPSVAPRGGVSAGDVLFRLGDYYGPVVNLASRLVDEAIPGEVLTDQHTVDGSNLEVRPAGRRVLKGFPDPLTVWSIDGPATDG